MAKVGDRVKETSATTGTGTLDLAGAPTGFRGFGDEFTSGDSVYYLCVDDVNNPTEYEYGIGTFTSGTPDTLSRNSVEGSSNGGSKVSWVAGCTVISTPTAAFLNALVAFAGGITQSAGRIAMSDGAAWGGYDYFMGRNRIINGNFAVNQRGYATGTALGAGVYAHDRWSAGAGGCTYTFAASAPDTTITITAGTLKQVIEDKNIEGGTYTLSWSGTAQAQVDGGGFANSPITVTGKTSGTAVTVEFGTGTVGKVQFEAGSIGTAFERRSFGAELALCQRYYAKTFPQGTKPAQATGITGAVASDFAYANSAGCIGQWTFPITMRASPTITTFNPGAAAATWRDQGNTANTAVSVSTPSDREVRLQADTSTVAGTSYRIHATADAEL